MSNQAKVKYPTFHEAFWVWLKIGLLSFGGPTGQISLMHGELVDKRRWINDARFLQALNYCMLLPGPEAQQLSIYTGWLLFGIRGGVVAGILFVVPGALLIGLVSFVYVYFGDIPIIKAAFVGLKPIVIAIIIFALWRIAKKALTSWIMWLIAALAFAAIYFGSVGFPWIIGAALSIGLLSSIFNPQLFSSVENSHSRSPSRAASERYLINSEVSQTKEAPSMSKTIVTVLLWSLIWLAPLLIGYLFFQPDHIYFKTGWFFVKAALLTFGGAYVVLPYVAQNAVEYYHWLTAAQMLDGLALAETTPGPLILVLQFVGFLAGWNSTGELPVLTACIVAGLTVWLTFAPGFLFIFAGAPWIEHIRQYARLNYALHAVTAAVVGVVLNLAVWFAWQVLFSEGAAVNWLYISATGFSLVLLKHYNWDVFRLVGLGLMAGLVVGLF